MDVIRPVITACIPNNDYLQQRRAYWMPAQSNFLHRNPDAGIHLVLPAVVPGDLDLPQRLSLTDPNIAYVKIVRSSTPGAHWAGHIGFLPQLDAAAQHYLTTTHPNNQISLLVDFHRGGNSFGGKSSIFSISTKVSTSS
jgi:hypothetical protein